ncbi:MAG: transglutaminase-like domain-containing protein, partial [Candidatus Thorarchaeota archaeon]
MSATKVTKRRMSLVTLVSTMFLLATLAWALTTFYFVQTGNVRTQTPHEEYDEVEEWPYDLNWAGGRTNWFDDINYTDMPMDQELPDDLLDHLEDVLFAVEPQNPPQLWRKTAYDSYSGSSWSKSLDSTQPLTLITQDQAESQNNTIYRVFLNVTVGPNVGSIEIPSLFPEAQLIENSFRTHPQDRLREYDLEIDEYGTVLFSPLLEGTTGENILVSYNLTYASQDIDRIANNALPGTSAPAEISSLYSTLEGVDLTQRVIDNVSQFEDVGDDAYEKAMAVDMYFRNNFELMIGEDEYPQRPEEGREVTDWFLERGGGLPMDFATAYSVFMRELDIPARMVAGYAVGDADDGHRVVKVKHMIFWSEVYIPTAGEGDGEWIQVVPLPLTGDLGITDIPENTGEGDVELWVWPSSYEPWAIIGEPFNLSSLLMVQSQPVSAPETIHFYDCTDDVEIGSATIEQGSNLPLANITYIFPDTASTGAHNISATWNGSSVSVTNYTSVYATGEPDPLRSPLSISTEDGFVVSETVEMNLKLGLDNYTAYWEDTIHVHGVMTRDGEPVDGSTLDNDQIQIMWDEGWYGNATIQSDGSYELDIYVDPLDTLRMTTGNHTVWASYAGEFTEEGYPELTPARSEDNSTVAVYGRIGFSLGVSPHEVYRGNTLQYEGILELLNGTPLPGEDVGIFFDWTQIDTVVTNDSGGFVSSYNIPSDQPTGNFSANVNWTSSYSLVAGNWSDTFDIEVRSSLTNLSIDSAPQNPDPVHIWEILTVNGTLRNAIHGNGLAEYNVSLWWKNGTDARIVANETTGTDGYYEFNYNVSAGYEGEVTYWVEFDSPVPEYESCQSENLTITVKRWDLEIHLQTNPNPVHLLETLTINGSVYLPETSEFRQNTHLTIWWHNSTGTYNLTGAYTDSTGSYSYNYIIPFSHELSTAEVWATVSPPSPAIAGNESVHILQEVTNYDSSITVHSNDTVYHLNETVHLNGTLLKNGTPEPNTIVYIHWDNGTLQVFNVTTDATGTYDFNYTLTPSDGPSTVNVYVNYTSPTRLYDNATASLDSPLTLQLYQLELTGATNATEY